ncbi:MAG: phosphatase PAP2 family protein [Bacteroidales bacterium]|nr:phosphatase PAP2 family protein [Bacteroidales bacterium]
MNRNSSFKLLAVEKITIVYILLTTIIVLFLSSKSLNLFDLIGYRILIFSSIIALAYIYKFRESRYLIFFRYFFLGGLLVYWYPDTFNINRVLPNQDYLIALLEQNIFGCQPSILFSGAYPQHWISEYLNMGYFSYYIIILGSSLYFWFYCKEKFDAFFFILIGSFYLYYLIYILFPTAGPQYYFAVVGVEQIQHHIYPVIGSYFDLHNELTGLVPNKGFFENLVEHTQKVGERPTAAFPSSHVGISTLILILIYQFQKKGLFLIILPFYIALVIATVFIKAHYVVDVIAGFLLAFLFYYFMNKIYQKYFSARII